MADLIEAVRGGEVSRIYCHTTDRLARDAEYGLVLWNACKDAGTIIRPGSQTFDPREPGYLTLWGVLLTQAEEDLDRITRKNQDSQDFGRDHTATCPLPGRPHRGRCHLVGCEDPTHCRLAHKRGRSRYGEDPAHPAEVPALARLLELFEREGSFLGTAKAATAEGLPTRFGAPWDVLSVSRIVRRHRVDVPTKGRQGARARSPRMFSGLLLCGGTRADGRPCQQIMSSMPRPGGRHVGYVCRAAHNDRRHSRPYVISEAKLLPAVREEAGRYRAPGDEYQDTDRTAELAVLDAERRRTLEQSRRGMLGMDDAEAVIRDIKTRMDGLAAQASPTAIPQAVDWTWPAPVLNKWLRVLWTSVALGPDLLPDGFAWRFPQWRSPD
jgi:hypothetical protein